MEKMNKNQSKTKVDESSSKSNSVLGRGEEGISSVPFTRGSNFEEGSSSSHSHVNNHQEHQRRLMMLRSQGMHPPPVFSQHVNHMDNLEEEQRLMRLPYHRIMQRMPHTQPTDPSSSSKAPVYPAGSRFLPTDLGCVRVHLRNKVEKNKSGFITTLDLYKDDPWLLDHVQNDLFPRGEWYYFTPRNKRGTSSCSRTVRGRGCGTWKSTTTKESIKDKYEKVQGYKQSLVYNKTDVNGDAKPTGWNMMEYCLHQENQDDLVLCRIKGTIKKIEFVEEVKNNILSNQVQEEASANGVETRTTLQEDHQQQQHQEKDTPPVVSIPPPHDGQGLGVETTQNNDQNLPQEDHDDASPPTQQQQQPQEQDASFQFNLTDEFQYSGYVMTMQNNFRTMLQINPCDATQQQQQQDAPPVLVPPPPHEGQDTVLEEMMNDENNFMTRWEEYQQYQWDDYINVDELFRVEEMMPMDDILQRPVPEARDVGAESAY